MCVCKPKMTVFKTILNRLITVKKDALMLNTYSYVPLCHVAALSTYFLLNFFFYYLQQFDINLMRSLTNLDEFNFTVLIF